MTPQASLKLVGEVRDLQIIDLRECIAELPTIWNSRESLGGRSHSVAYWWALGPMSVVCRNGYFPLLG